MSAYREAIAGRIADLHAEKAELVKRLVIIVAELDELNARERDAR